MSKFPWKTTLAGAAILAATAYAFARSPGNGHGPQDANAWADGASKQPIDMPSSMCMAA